jgi:pentatricopeptide repeat protein
MSFLSRFFFVLMLISLSGCDADLRDFCSSSNDARLADAIVQIEKLRTDPSRPSRALASMASASSKRTEQNSGRGIGRIGFLAGGGSPDPSELSRFSGLGEDDRDRWQSWSESELKTVETYLDWANLHREESADGEKVRRKLTEVANRLVAFHGYCQEGRVERMLQVLHSIESDRRQIRAVVCKSR